jgi:hypothetical protein
VKRAFARHEQANEDLAAARADREAAVFGAAEDGEFPFREIASWVGLKHQTISTMHKRERQRRTEAQEDGNDGTANDDE